MTARNYDTTTNCPYTRVSEFQVIYSPQGVPEIQIKECMAIVDGNGQVQHLADPPAAWTSVDLSIVPDSYPVVNPATGAAVGTQISSLQACMLHTLALIRAYQVARDAAKESATP